MNPLTPKLMPSLTPGAGEIKSPANEQTEQPTAPKDGFNKSADTVLEKFGKGAKNLMKYVGAGFGGGAGAVGGFAIAGTAMAAGNLMTGLLSHSLTMAAMTAGTIVAGGAGAALFGIAGLIGGYEIVNGVATLVGKAYHAIKGS